MSEQEREVASRIKFSLAEASILHEELQELIGHAESLRSAIGSDNGLMVMREWNAVAEHLNYVGTLLNLKGSAAAKKWIEESGMEG